jgi:hypothetical protein
MRRACLPGAAIAVTVLADFPVLSAAPRHLGCLSPGIERHRVVHQSGSRTPELADQVQLAKNLELIAMVKLVHRFDETDHVRRDSIFLP